ncbi:MAG: hypothetical protein WA081_09800 [Desulfosalsimonadaceae bacterium]
MNLKSRIEALERRHDEPMRRDLGAVIFGLGELDADGWAGPDLELNRYPHETDEVFKNRVVDALVLKNPSIVDMLRTLAGLLPV